jgi:hypothetical protein
LAWSASTEMTTFFSRPWPASLTTWYFKADRGTPSSSHALMAASAVLRPENSRLLMFSPEGLGTHARPVEVSGCRATKLSEGGGPGVRYKVTFALLIASCWKMVKTLLKRI